jgi:hypothetical protein
MSINVHDSTQQNISSFMVCGLRCYLPTYLPTLPYLFLVRGASVVIKYQYQCLHLPAMQCMRAYSSASLWFLSLSRPVSSCSSASRLIHLLGLFLDLNSYPSFFQSQSKTSVGVEARTQLPLFPAPCSPPFSWDHLVRPSSCSQSHTLSMTFFRPH